METRLGSTKRSERGEKKWKNLVRCALYKSRDGICLREQAKAAPVGGAALFAQAREQI